MEIKVFNYLIIVFPSTLAFILFFKSELISDIKSENISKEKHWFSTVSTSFLVRSTSSVSVLTVWYNFECFFVVCVCVGFICPLVRADRKVQVLFSSKLTSKIIANYHLKLYHDLVCKMWTIEEEMWRENVWR